jgi:hypothetical protein
VAQLRDAAAAAARGVRPSAPAAGGGWDGVEGGGCCEASPPATWVASIRGANGLDQERSRRESG